MHTEQSGQADRVFSIVTIGCPPKEQAVMRAFCESAAAFQLVGQVETGREGIELCEATQPDFVVVDVAPIDMSSVRAIKPLRASCPSTYILMASVTSQPDWMRDAMLEGAHDFICYPLSNEYLEDAFSVLVQRIKHETRQDRRDTDG